MRPNTQTVVTELRRWHGLKGAVVFLEAAELLVSLERELAETRLDVENWMAEAEEARRILANDQTGSAKAAGAPGAESTAALTNDRTVEGEGRVEP